VTPAAPVDVEARRGAGTSEVEARRGAAAFVALVATVTVLGAAGWLPRWAGLLHLVALPPLDLAADLRWLVARATGWPTFTVGVLTVLAVRTAVWALVLSQDGRPRWRLAASLQLAAVLPLLAAAQFDFVARSALYARLFGVAVGVLLVTWVVLAGVVGTTERRLGAAVRASTRHGFRAVELAVYLLGLLLLGTLADVLGPGGAVALVPVSGGWTWLVLARLRRPAPRWSWWGAAAVAVGALALWALVVVTRGEAGFDVSDAQRDGSALIMSGINSASGEGAIFELEPERIGFDCDAFHYFSYAGPGDGQPQGSAACPKREGAPYEPEETQRPFEEQVALLEAQVAPLEPPVVVLAHSQAAWVAWQAAAEGRLDGVSHLVLVGPFPSSPLGFPPPGEAGQGRVGGELFRLLEPVPELVDFDFLVDAPLTRQLLATPDAASEVFGAPLPDGMHALALTATSDLALMPDGWRFDEPVVDACPIREAHPYLPITPDLHAAVDRFLDGDRGGDPCPRWPEWYRRASQAFGAPAHDR
jgi:hypothetical protein